MDLSEFEKKIFSQNGEDGITIKIIELIYNEPTNKNYIEFGVQDGQECNTRILRENYGWFGIQMDGGNENHSIGLYKEFLTKENIVKIFKKYNTPKHLNLLCIDIDFNDFYCLKEILKNYKLDIIICEYNATHLPNEDKVIIYDRNGGWDGSNYFGASLLALTKLCNNYNYSLVYCESRGVNCFFIHNDIIQEKGLNFININNVEKLYKYPKYGSGPNGGHSIDKHNRNYISSKKAFNK